MKKDSHAIEQLNKAYDSLAWMNLTANLYNLTESIRDGRYGMEKGGLQEELNGIYGQLLTLIRKYADEGNASSFWRNRFSSCRIYDSKAWRKN